MLDQKRQKLLAARLADLLTWTKPEIVRTIGPYDPAVFDRYETVLRRVISDCTEKLQGYTEDEISILVGETPEDPPVLGRHWRNFRSDEISRISNSMPPWHAGGFGDPSRAADFDYWCKMPLLAIHELLCLSVGVEPDSFEQKHITDLGKREIARLWPSLKFLVRRREQLVREFGRVSTDRRVSLKRFLEWADRVDFEAHPEFLHLIRQYHSGGERTDAGTAKSASQDKREVDKIAQLFTVMAIDHLGYDPKQARSPIPKEIVGLAASMGMSVSDDTVRKYLKIGARFISEDWKPE